jgi:gluconate kinase
MELISSFAAIVAGAVAAVLGHFVAHDLYEGAPRHAKRLLDHATRILPETDQERYAEEWLAHLNECKGAFGKFRHAAECLLVARKLRRIYEQRTGAEPEAIEFVFLSEGKGAAKVSMGSITALPFLKMMAEVFALEKQGKLDALVPSEEVKELMANPGIERDKFFEMGAAIKLGPVLN